MHKLQILWETDKCIRKSGFERTELLQQQQFEVSRVYYNVKGNELYLGDFIYSDFIVTKVALHAN